MCTFLNRKEACKNIFDTLVKYIIGGPEFVFKYEHMTFIQLNISVINNSWIEMLWNEDYFCLLLMFTQPYSLSSARKMSGRKRWNVNGGGGGGVGAGGGNKGIFADSMDDWLDDFDVSKSVHRQDKTKQVIAKHQPSPFKPGGRKNSVFKDEFDDDDIFG